MKRITVFCGSYSGGRADYAEAARDLAAALVRNDAGLVYGGGHVGLMGILADEVLRLGGKVTGVIPRGLMRREVGHRAVSDMRVVETMHERKALMAELSDGFVALPGGLGTLEEIFEVWTWAQLGMHQKPIGFLDIAGYFSPLMTFLDYATGEGFIRPELRRAAIVDRDADMLLRRFESYVAPSVEKWIDRDET